MNAALRCLALVLVACSAHAQNGDLLSSAQFDDKTLLLHPRCAPRPALPLGPFVTLGDGSVLGVDGSRALGSRDEGRTWTAQPLFARAGRYQCRPERALLRTREGTVLLAFLNNREMAFRWDQARGGPLPGCRLPVYVSRSTDDGRTWEEPRLVQDDYCGALRSMIQLRSGRVVLGSQAATNHPGRHVCFTWASDDEGKTWKRSNILDLGEHGGYGDHGGGIEPTLAQLREGRLWMLIRTDRGCFSEAFSADEGLTWTAVRPSSIEASGSPGQLRRLQSRRLVLLWNRYVDEEKKAGRREQLSMAFSEDEGRTWTKPVVIAQDPMPPGGREAGHRLSYPYVHERVPGELWITTMQGPLRLKLREDDFLPRRLSEQTYRVAYVPAARIALDGRADEPAWSEANLEDRIRFPWTQAEPPRTEFRALYDDTHLHFSFRIRDADIVVSDKLRDEQDAVFEDRAEMYFSLDDQMKDYFCLEVDSRGRVFDYRGAYYRHLEPAWKLEGLETKASPLPEGYEIEGRIPLASLTALGFPRPAPGVRIRWGLYRAEFSQDRSGRPVVQRESIHNRGRQLDGPPPLEEWMSWVDPKTEEPDFHVPTSLGWLEFGR